MRQWFRVFEIGDKASLDLRRVPQKARSLAREISRLSPRMAVILSLGGYQTDRREIWDIPEAREYIIRFSEELFQIGVKKERLLPQTLNLIKACYAVRAGHVIHTLGSDRDTVRVLVGQVEDYYQQAVREVQ